MIPIIINGPIVRESNTAHEAWEAIQREIAGASNSQKLTNFKKKEHSSNVETALNTTTTNSNTKENKNVWYFDSGCTQHMTNNQNQLSSTMA